MNAVQELYRKQAKALIPKFARRNMEAFYCDTAQEAKEYVLSLIPEGSAVTSGGSVTLEQTGIMQELQFLIRCTRRLRFGLLISPQAQQQLRDPLPLLQQDCCGYGTAMGRAG